MKKVIPNNECAKHTNKWTYLFIFVRFVVLSTFACFVNCCSESMSFRNVRNLDVFLNSSLQIIDFASGFGGVVSPPKGHATQSTKPTNNINNIRHFCISGMITGFQGSEKRLVRPYTFAMPRPRVFNFPIGCLLYTSPSPRDKRQSRMPSSA